MLKTSLGLACGPLGCSWCCAAIGKRNAPAKEEEPVSLDRGWGAILRWWQLFGHGADEHVIVRDKLPAAEGDMSLDELIEKDYLPPKLATGTDDGCGGGVAAWKGWKESSGGGAGGGWKDKRSDTWGNDSWKAVRATPVAWKPKAETSWSSSTEKWGAGDDWSSKASWTPRESGKGAEDRFLGPRLLESYALVEAGGMGYAAGKAPAWRPTNEQEREERWNRGNDDRWERREDLRGGPVRVGARAMLRNMEKLV
eukprot:Skav230805  [mRNA]  locus=scaffold851:99081:105650:- [translate_table: standard]